MTTLRAAWVVPVDGPPIRDGWVSVAAGRIAAIGGPDDRPPTAAPVRNLGEVVLLPGLVNAHTHLELSWLRGRVPPASAFTTWVAQLFATRAGVERRDDADVRSAALAAARECREFGTVAIGDIGNSLASIEPIAQANLWAVVFHELIGVKETDGRLVESTRALRACAATSRVRVSVAPHAPYSVSAELFRAIRAEVSASAVPITSVHVGESPEEVQLLRDGSGAWAALLRQIGAWRDDWTPPGIGPLAYLDALGVVDAHTLVVHAVQLTDAELERLRQHRATIVTCPRSNQWVGVGVPPLERFYRSGAAVAIGTDSLASVADLNVFAELKTMRGLAPGVSARRLLESATLVGATALGLGDDLGTLTVGKRAEIIAVDAAGVDGDIEEYLLSGIGASAIRWAATTPAAEQVAHHPPR